MFAGSGSVDSFYPTKSSFKACIMRPGVSVTQICVIEELKMVVFDFPNLHWPSRPSEVTAVSCSD